MARRRSMISEPCQRGPSYRLSASLVLPRSISHSRGLARAGTIKQRTIRERTGLTFKIEKKLSYSTRDSEGAGRQRPREKTSRQLRQRPRLAGRTPTSRPERE